jgi:hypothetical protein
VNPVRDVSATMPCPVCGAPFVLAGRRRHCSTACRQTAFRLCRRAVVQPLVAKSDTVYACPSCDARLLGEQRCDDCDTWACRLGPGGPCPCCDEPISITELLGPEQFATTSSAKTARRRS